VVAVLVVVSVSKTYAASESLVDRGVEDLSRSAVRRWARMVDLPAPDSPLSSGVSQMLAGSRLACEPQDLQEHDCLVLGAVSKSQPGTISQVFGASHGAAVLAAIRSFGRRSVCVQRDESMRRESSGRVRGMEAAGEMGREMSVGLEMERQRRQRRLAQGSSVGTAQGETHCRSQ
jgi:hypothetical protein